MGPGRFWELITRPYRQDVIALADGETKVIDARGFWKLGVLAHAGATVVIHRVDSWKAWGAPDSGAERNVTGPSAGAHSAIAVDWPFYHVTVSGGACSITLL